MAPSMSSANSESDDVHREPEENEDPAADLDRRRVGSRKGRGRNCRRWRRSRLCRRSR